VERACGALDLLLEIEECMKGNKKERTQKPLPVGGPDRVCRDEFGSESHAKGWDARMPSVPRPFFFRRVVLPS